MSRNDPSPRFAPMVRIGQMQAQYQCSTRLLVQESFFPKSGWLAIAMVLFVVLNPGYSDDNLPPESERLSRIQSLLDAAQSQGDAARGLKIYTNAKAACSSCHRIGTAGSDIGPELTSIAKNRTPHEIVESLFWPNLKIDPNFRPWKLLLDDGGVITGYIDNTQSNTDSIAIKDPATGVTQSYARNSIDEQKESLSLMPNGLFESLEFNKQADLIRFLLDLGTNPSLDRAHIESTIRNAVRHEPASFPFDLAPINPELRPGWKQPINQNRLYDFYSKQARYFLSQPTEIDLIQEFTGLDGEKFGHWGSQNEDSWRGSEWNLVEPNLVQCNVLVHPTKTINRAVCFRFGKELAWSACYDSDRLQYDFFWQGGFVSYSDVRHGFMDGVRIVGKEIVKPNQTDSALSILGLNLKEPVRYLGYFIHEEQVLFEFEAAGTVYIDFVSEKSGVITRNVVPKSEIKNPEWLRGGSSRNPQILETDIKLGTGAGYIVDTIEIPFDNPWRSSMAIGDHDFLSDGTAIVATMQGDVFRVEGIEYKLGNNNNKASWQRIATGLHHALGVVVHDDEIFVLGRNQITRLHDLNGDKLIDRYECYSNAFETSPNGHDYICGLVRDPQGRFYTASGNQGVLQISADGLTANVIATGFRNPDGIGLLPDGTISVPASEGEWTPASMVSLVKPLANGKSGEFATSPPPFYGYRGPKADQPIELPFVYLPRGVDNSSGGQFWVSDERMGPIANQILHTSYGAATAMLLLRDEVDGIDQGGIFVLPGEYLSGVHRAKTNPVDGQVYLSGMYGWGNYSIQPGAFQRLRYTGDDILVPVGFHVFTNGVRVDFSNRIDSDSAQDASKHFAQCWNYRYSPGYGSKEYSVFNPTIAGHDRLNVTSSHVLNNGKSLFLEIPSLQKCNQLHLHLNVNKEEEKDSSVLPIDLYLTVHAMDRSFTGFENAVAVTSKVELPHPLKRDLDRLQKSLPNRWRNRLEGARAITIDAKDNLQFSERIIEVRAGETIQFTFRNPDVVPHNWALIKPDSLEKIGALANGLVNDPDAYLTHYVPASDDVICFTDVVEPKNEFTIYFQAPSEPGRYPYLCTFPGHWMVMNGVLVVK